MILSSALEDSYREQGAALVKDVFSADDLALLARGVQKNVEQPSPTSFYRFGGEAGRGAYTLDYGCHRWVPEYVEFAATSSLSKIAAQLLQSQRVCFVDETATYQPNPDYPFDDGKVNAKLQPGQRLSEDPECFPALWEAKPARP
jgi:hypothetical protein